MKILKVIHGYPPTYSAGSEVYSQNLCSALADRHAVQVFTRIENLLDNDFAYSHDLDPADARVILHKINIPRERWPLKYQHKPVDDIFEKLLKDFSPDVVHFGHLNHLSTNLVKTSKKFGAAVVFTLHDFWLLCPRGQFIQRNSKGPSELCDGQNDHKCAQQCFKGYQDNDGEINESYFESWVNRRMKAVQDIFPYVDRFIAPSRHLREKFLKSTSISPEKIILMDYGFDLKRLKGRQRVRDGVMTFGYIGTHIPGKGIQDLITAVSLMHKASKLLIWGSPKPEVTPYLKEVVQKLPSSIKNRINFMGPYANHKIVEDVFNHIDVLVVPSIWEENSPLVIHEAQQLRIPVITADKGGMAEYVHEGVNGFLYKFRDPEDLSKRMDEAVLNPETVDRLGHRGYLYSADGNVIDIKNQARNLESIYREILLEKEKEMPTKPGPWRITFDTNPDHCNFKCVMCECFSPYSSVKKERVDQHIHKRVMDINLIRKILEDAKDTPLQEIIPSTMGEPLLYKEFSEIIKMCHEFSVRLNLTTNGSFPILGVEKWASLLLPVLSDIKISWNGATKETHESIMLYSNWEEVLSNLETFVAMRDDYVEKHQNHPTVTLQLTFLESNVHELADIVRLGIRLGIDRIKGHHLWAHFEEIEELSMRRSKESIQRWNKAAADAIHIANTHLLPNGKKIRLENIDLLDPLTPHYIRPQGVCPFLGKEAWINTEGKFSPCCAPDKQRDSLGEFGNVKAQTISEIFQSETYQSLRKTYLGHPLCEGCNMKKDISHVH